MAILFLDFFGSDPSKMDQTCKIGEQTSQILKFKPKGLDFQYYIMLVASCLEALYKIASKGWHVEILQIFF